MSGPVSYASAAGSATNKESKKHNSNSTAATNVPLVKSSSQASADSPASSTFVSTLATTASTDPSPDTFLEESGNQNGEKESFKSNIASSASIDKFKSGLTPAPVPTTNPWASVSRQPASSSVNTEPSVSRKASQSKAPLDSVHWPKPDEGPSTTEGSNSAPPTIKTRPGKEKWIPISYTPVTSKPRGGKSRNGKTHNSNNNTNNQSASTSGNGQAANSNGTRRGSKSQGSRPGSQVKKTDGKAPPKARSSSANAANAAKPDNNKKSASEPTGSRSAPVVSTKEEPTKEASEAKSEAGAFSENSLNNGHRSKHYYSNPHNFNNRNGKSNGKGYNRRQPHYNNGNFNGLQYYRNDYDNFPIYPPVGPIDLFRPIIAQIEYYFSPDNLCKDTYLRALMNSNGWVPLNLLASFYRVSRLTNGDYNLFVEACKWAPSVEVVGDKIRLRQNWANWVFPYSERHEAGKNEDSPLPVKLLFNPAKASPFIPRTEVKENSENSAPASVTSEQSAKQ
jgi:la-related protein 1